MRAASAPRRGSKSLASKFETAVSEIGVNRNELNDILRAEMGYTFTGYLNKLGLTEASCLLVEIRSASIAEIAYSLGHTNGRPRHSAKYTKRERASQRHKTPVSPASQGAAAFLAPAAGPATRARFNKRAQLGCPSQHGSCIQRFHM